MTDLGYRSKIDNRVKMTPGSKFYEWELKGVPLRIEIGPREAENGVVTLVTRVTRQRVQVKIEELQIAVEKALGEVEDQIKDNAWSWLRSHVHRAEDLEKAKGHIDGEGGIVEVPWCGEHECGTKIEEKLDVRVLGTPMEEVHPKGRCVICLGEAKEILRLAKAY